MADEFPIKITTSADTAGADKAAESLQEVGKAAAEAGKQGAEMGQDLAQGGQEGASGLDRVKGELKGVSAGLKAGKILTGALAQALSGDLAGAFKATGLAIKVFNVALRANPIGLAIGAVSALTAAWGLLRSKISGTDAEADKASEALANTGKAGKEAEAGLEGAADGAGKTEKASAKALDPVQRLVAALNEAASAARSARDAQNELAEARLNETLSTIDRQAAEGKITSEEAATRRGQLQSNREKSSIAAEIYDLEEEQRRTQQQRKYAEDQLRMREERKPDEAEAERIGEIERLGRARGRLPSPSLIARAQIVQERLSKIGTPELSQQDAEKLREETKKREAENARKLEIAKSKFRTAENKEATERLNKERENQKRAEADKQKQIEEEKKAKLASNDLARRTVENEVSVLEAQRNAAKPGSAERKELIGKLATYQKQLVDLDEQKAGLDGKDDAASREAFNLRRQQIDRSRDEQLARKTPGADQASAAVREAQGIANDAAGLKGPSPEVTKRISEASTALADGATGEELDALNQILEKLATGLEKRARSDDAATVKQLQSRVKRLEGIINRIDATNTSSGA
jgi:hypothetical protein